MKDAYRLLLRLYPRDYRVLFASEMQRAFENASHASRGRYVRFAARELAGMLLGAAREWMVKLASDPSVRARVLCPIGCSCVHREFHGRRFMGIA